MNEGFGKEEPRVAGLTTAALAAAVVPVESKKDIKVGARETSGTVAALDGQAGPLFSSDEANEFRTRWDTIQAGFVDEPRESVAQADSLVAGAMQRLAEMFADERAKLDGQWDRGDSVSTEDLRLALRCYRSFFGRLLSV